MVHSRNLIKVILCGLFYIVQSDSMTTQVTKIDEILVGYDPYFQKNTSSILQCVHLCLRHRQCCCKSINIIQNVHSKTFQCQILNYTITHENAFYSKKTKSQHIQPINNQLNENQPKDNQTKNNQIEEKPKQDCMDWKKSGHNVDGIYEIMIDGKAVNVFCDMVTDGGGWIVFQNRFDGSVDFFRSWDEYRDGFGDLKGEFWLGNEFIHQLSRRHVGGMEFWIEGTAFDGDSTHRKSKNFFIGTEQESYKMSSLTLLTGEAVSTNEGKMMDGMKFSTTDRDNDNWEKDCADFYLGGWWFDSCFEFHFNGKYYAEGVTVKGYKGLAWIKVYGKQSLKKTRMMIR